MANRMLAKELKVQAKKVVKMILVANLVKVETMRIGSAGDLSDVHTDAATTEEIDVVIDRIIIMDKTEAMVMFRAKRVALMMETSQVTKEPMEAMITSSVEDLIDAGHMDAVSITEGIDAVPTIGSNNHKMRHHNHKSNNIILITITSILR